jgi:hypothetical protein
MFVDSSTEYIGLPIVLTIECGVANEIKRHGPIFFKTCLFMLFCSWSSSKHTPIKPKFMIKKNNQKHPHTLGLTWVSINLCTWVQSAQIGWYYMTLESIRAS